METKELDLLTDLVVLLRDVPESYSKHGSEPLYDMGRFTAYQDAADRLEAIIKELSA
jgi:hypothetical protein